ncbi:hypothetical protein [Vibrio cionasavignyae]|uniref:hypothetical protein n=1 Tax=Vibrio cionasavignyae TaxID=2910252 RepID=UPI003D0D4E2C
MSYPDEKQNTAGESSGWWDSVIEGAGEIVGGAVDVVGDFSGDWLGIKVDNELDRAESSNPDENRKNNNNYQQPNGQPVNTAPKGMQWQTMALIALVIVVALGGLAFAFKGGK